MGCNDCDGSTVKDYCFYDNHPYHEVYLDAYRMDMTEVTAGQFAACAADGGPCDGQGGCGWTGEPGGKPNHPMNCLSWYAADTYCKWAGKALCTEAQWEKGARGGCEKYPPNQCKADSRIYPWGSTWPDCDGQTVVDFQCNCGGTCPVGTHPKGVSLYGLHDLAGNVAEWVADWFQLDYYCNGPDASGDEICDKCGEWYGWPEAWANPPGPETGVWRVDRGGTFCLSYVGVSARGKYGPSAEVGCLGFRCCAPADD